MHSNKTITTMKKTTIVNVVITVNNLSKDTQYKISAHPRELEGITAGLTLEQELQNCELVQSYVDRKSNEDIEDLEVVQFEIITDGLKRVDSKGLERLGTDYLKNKTLNNGAAKKKR